MLLLGRRVDQTIIIGGKIEIKVVRMNGSQVVLGITAPEEINIVRGELVENTSIEASPSSSSSFLKDDCPDMLYGVKQTRNVPSTEIPSIVYSDREWCCINLNQLIGKK